MADLFGQLDLITSILFLFFSLAGAKYLARSNAHWIQIIVGMFFQQSGWFGQLDLMISILFFSPASEKFLAHPISCTTYSKVTVCLFQHIRLVWSAWPGDECLVLLPHWGEIPGSLKHELVALKLPSVHFSISAWFGQLDLVTCSSPLLARSAWCAKPALVALKLRSVYFSISGWFSQLDHVISILFFSPH